MPASSLVSTPTQEVFSCSNLSVRFEGRGDGRAVLEGVSFSCHQGEFLSILGPSGTGKTTLLRILAGILSPGEGSSVRFEGAEMTGPAPGVALVFQNYAAALLPWRTVERNVALSLEGSVPRAERQERVRDALQLVGLAERAKDYPWQLSGGMQQRVQIARALVSNPKVLLMDEPFGALDAMTKEQLQDELLRVQEMTGATIVFVTHDIDEAVYLSDRLLVIDGMPARVASELAVDLPRPRSQVSTKESATYLETRHAAYRALHREGIK